MKQILFTMILCAYCTKLVLGFPTIAETTMPTALLTPAQLSAKVTELQENAHQMCLRFQIERLGSVTQPNRGCEDAIAFSISPTFFLLGMTRSSSLVTLRDTLAKFDESLRSMLDNEQGWPGVSRFYMRHDNQPGFEYLVSQSSHIQHMANARLRLEQSSGDDPSPISLPIIDSVEFSPVIGDSVATDHAKHQLLRTFSHVLYKLRILTNWYEHLSS